MTHTDEAERTATVALGAAFSQRYGVPPTHRVRAPGRVNLIGEHIDYAGLPVFPMAIQRAIRMGFRPIDVPEFRIASDLPGLEPRRFRLDAPIERYPSGDWGNYAVAAARALQERFAAEDAVGNVGAARESRRASGARLTPGGLEALVTSDLPPAAGLSSSSALLVACGLGLLSAGDATIEPLRLAALMAEAERLTGTLGGGMDQAICLCAVEGTASIIDFDPLRLSTVPVPPGWSFVVAHSLVEARKSGTARATYNRRRAEVEAALREVSAKLDPPDGESPTPRPGYRQLLAERDPTVLQEVADRVLRAELRPRFRHVVTEADRVRQARVAMLEGDMSGFGELMNASHRSLRDDFEVSTPQLDELVTIALAAGAVGARLTGAGMGGSVVALVASSGAPELVRALRDRFYSGRLPLETEAGAARLAASLFVARPSGGASVDWL